jgi:hypothetical protein
MMIANSCSPYLLCYRTNHRSLNVQACARLFSGSSAVDYRSWASMTALTSLDLSQCACTTGHISAIAEHCKQLKCLYLRHYWCLQEAALHALAAHCSSSLQLLDLGYSNFDRLSSFGVAALAKLQALQTLSLYTAADSSSSSRNSVTDAVLLRIGRGCAALQNLNIAGIALQPATLCVLQEERHLRVVHLHGAQQHALLCAEDSAGCKFELLADASTTSTTSSSSSSSNSSSSSSSSSSGSSSTDG